MRNVECKICEVPGYPKESRLSERREEVSQRREGEGRERERG